jgi:hypothetical protein
MTVRVMKFSVPGATLPDVGIIDIETRKVPLDPPYRMTNGELLKSRWSVICAGLVRHDYLYLVWGDNELEILDKLGELTNDIKYLWYYATRQFDEMILRGRFTNARRAHAPVPFYPSMPGAERIHWLTLPKIDRPVRQFDLPSKEVPKAWAKGQRVFVLSHLLRDMAEMAWIFGEPENSDWCGEIVLSARAASCEVICEGARDVYR